MNALDLALWSVLERREACRNIRRYGVARFLRQTKRYVAKGGRFPERGMYDREAPEIAALMAEVFAIGLL